LIISLILTEAKQMIAFIAQRQFGPSADGRAMTQALLNMFVLVIPWHASEGNLYEFIRWSRYDYDSEAAAGMESI
jgi:hypothetical protein